MSQVVEFEERITAMFYPDSRKEAITLQTVKFIVHPKIVDSKLIIQIPDFYFVISD